MSRRRSGHEATAARYRVALLGGAVCGGFWVLLVATVLDAVRPGLLTVPLMAGIWAATGLVMAALLSQPGPLRQVWGRAAVATGLHGLALPVVAVISFVVAGAQWSPSNPGNLELSATVLGVRLAATPTAIRVGVSGFVLGLLLLAIGDRALRGLDRPRSVDRLSR